jgi:hypothetical protein
MRSPFPAKDGTLVTAPARSLAEALEIAHSIRSTFG